MAHYSFRIAWHNDLGPSYLRAILEWASLIPEGLFVRDRHQVYETRRSGAL